MFLLVFFPRLDGFICFWSPSVVKKGTFIPFLHLLPMTGDFIVQALGFSQILVKYLPNICPDPSSYLVCCPSEWNIGVKTRLVCQSPQIGLILMVALYCCCSCLLPQEVDIYSHALKLIHALGRSDSDVDLIVTKLLQYNRIYNLAPTFQLHNAFFLLKMLVFFHSLFPLYLIWGNVWVLVAWTQQMRPQTTNTFEAWGQKSLNPRLSKMLYQSKTNRLFLQL